MLGVAIIDEHRTEVAALCRRLGVRRLDLFGSAARNDFDPATSDLDFVVQLDELSPSQYAQTYFALKEGLEQLLGCAVDLVTQPGLANPYFRDRVEAERRPIYAR